MKGISFSQVNVTLSAPPSVPNAYDLPVCQTQTREGHPLIISCWEPTEVELKLLMETKRLWLWTLSRTMPPTSIEVECPWDVDPRPSESDVRDDPRTDGELLPQGDAGAESPTCDTSG